MAKNSTDPKEPSKGQLFLKKIYTLFVAACIIFTTFSAINWALARYGVFEKPLPRLDVRPNYSFAKGELFDLKELEQLQKGFSAQTDSVIGNRLAIPGYLLIRVPLDTSEDSVLVSGDVFQECGCGGDKFSVTRYELCKQDKNRIWEKNFERKTTLALYFSPTNLQPPSVGGDNK